MRDREDKEAVCGGLVLYCTHSLRYETKLFSPVHLTSGSQVGVTVVYAAMLPCSLTQV